MAARSPEISRHSVVGIGDPAGKLYGHGLLIGVHGVAIVLTCHHVVATLKPANLRVFMRGRPGEPAASPVSAIVDSEHSSNHRDAAVLRLPVDPPASNPVLQNLDGRFYGGDLPKRAVGFSQTQVGTFAGTVGAATSPISLPMKGSFLGGQAGSYEFPYLFPLHDPTDARLGISGAPVFYEDGVIGLVHLTREEKSDFKRESYIVPISVWGEAWPELGRLIEPFTDGRLRARAIIKCASAIDVEADLGVAGYVDAAYVERTIDGEARRMVADADRTAAVMIVGKPKSGKTRLAHRLLSRFPNDLVIIPKAPSPPDEWEHSGLRDRGMTLLLDDLHAKPSWNPMSWIAAIKASGASRCHTIVTARDGAEFSQLIQTHGPFFESIGGVRAVVRTSGDGNHGGDFSQAEARQLAKMLGLAESEATRRFDGTPGSLALDLSAMQQRYNRLRDYTVGNVAQSRLLDSAKLLRDAFTPSLRSDMLRWVCENVRGNRSLSEEEWAALKRHTLEEGFGRFSDEEERFEIYTPYLEECVAYAPTTADIKALAPFLLDRGEPVLPVAHALFFRHQDFDSGRELLNAAIERGAKNGRRDLAIFLLLRSANDHETAKLLRKAIAESDGKDRQVMENMLGVALVNSPGDEAECERLLQQAVRRGFHRHHIELARLYQRLPGREKDAEQAFRDGIAAADDSDLRYLFNDFGAFLGSQKRYEEAAEELRRGCALGDKLACRNLWRYHRGVGAAIADPATVLRWFQQCTPGEDLQMLGGLLGKQGSFTLAEQAYVSAIERGCWQSLQDLAVLLTNTGQIKRLSKLISANAKSFTGEQLRTIADGLLPMHHGAEGLKSLLGVAGGLTNMQKKPLSPLRPAAEIFLREAIRSGDRFASFRLGLLLAQDAACADEAESAYRDAIVSGVTPAYSALGSLLAQNVARWSDAETVYREGISVNDKGSFAGLLILLMRMPGRQADLNELATLAVQRGIVDPTAMKGKHS